MANRVPDGMKSRMQERVTVGDQAQRNPAGSGQREWKKSFLLQCLANSLGKRGKRVWFRDILTNP